MKPFARLAGVALFGALVASAAEPTPLANPDTASARELIRRVLPDAADRFQCEVIAADSGHDVFEYEPGPGGTVVLRGNSALSLAVAFNQYLRREAHLDFDWLAAGPLHAPAKLPVPSAKVRRASATSERFILNYCTYGYTMPWWDWSHWERFIDWLAMNGVNRPLLETGEEAVWLRVWQQYGMSDAEIRAYFSGPAHLPWHRMANLDRWGGPLPSSYIESQADLQRHILGRVRSLGMKAILPAFAGHVPPQLVRLHPGAHVVPITPGWSGMPAIYATYFLDPSDPLFEDIQGRFLTEEVRMYGTDHLYAADPFNEIVPPSWEPAYLAHVSHSIYGGMAAADPDARWYQMSWTFLFDSLRSAWTPERLTTMLRAVPPGRMVLLDYAAEEQEFYSVTDNAYGLPFVWNYLGNFGGNTHLEAPLHKVATLGERAMRQPNCVGIGSTLEAIGVNPCVYTLLFELPWQPEDHSDLDAWITRYADLRAGGADPAVRRAWSKLREDVFRDNSRRKGTFGSIFQSMPPVVGWKGRTQNTHQDYPPEALVAALRDLFDAGPAARQADGYRFDVVNFTRQALCNYALTVEQQMVAAAQARDAKAFEREAQRFLELGGDLDDLLGTRREFLLGSWLADARALGTTFSEADYYERNAREIITAWHVPGGQLTDYASRQWNGLMRDYYLRRWEKWVALTTESLTHGTPFNDAAYLTWINEFTASWIEMHDAARYTVAPRGDDVVTARHLADKYLFTGAATDAPARP